MRPGRFQRYTTVIDSGNPIVGETTQNGKRYYETESGALYPSVTTILSSLPNTGLEEWRDKVGHEEADRITRVAASKGTNIHSVIEKYLKNDEDPTRGHMPDIKAMFKGMKPFVNKINPIYALETRLWSHKYKYAGRCDCIAVYEIYKDLVTTATAVIDFKNHRSDLMFSDDKIHKYLLQCSAYSIAFEEMTHIKVNHAVLIFGSNDFGATEHIHTLEQYKQEFLDIRRDFNDSLV